MKIRALSYTRLNLALTEPYTIAYETVSSAPQVVLRIDTDSGLTGWGCAAPDLPVTGERPEDVVKALDEVILPYLDGKDVFNYVRLLYDLKKQLPGRPSTMNMVDMALRDLVARKAGVPLYKLMGGFRDRIETSITIGILPLDETYEKAREYLARGFHILKIKGGRNVDEDIEKMLRLRELFGGDIRLRFDGNQGYTAEEAIRFVHEIRTAGLELFEQPTKRSDEDLLGHVTANVHVPVMADESMNTLTDMFRLASNELIDMINIKLMKVGGILEAVHINSVAKSAGIEAMVGCLDECALGIAAGLHFALSFPNVHYADLDGHLDLVDDPFAGMVTLKDGFLYPSEHEGLGLVNF